MKKGYESFYVKGLRHNKGNNSVTVSQISIL